MRNRTFTFTPFEQYLLLVGVMEIGRRSLLEDKDGSFTRDEIMRLSIKAEAMRKELQASGQYETNRKATEAMLAMVENVTTAEMQG